MATLILNVPDALYRRLERAAYAKRRTEEEMAVEAIEKSLEQEVGQTLPSEI